MKIVIAGAGALGTYLIQMLNQSDHDINVIDQDKHKLQEISSHYDVLTTSGNSTSIEILKEAKTEDADLFIALTELQESNIISCILSKKLGAKKTIARIDNGEYLHIDNKEYFNKLGIDSLIYPEILASEEIVNIIKQPGLNKTVEFASGKLSLYIIRIEKDSPYIGKTLIEIAEEYKDLEYRTVAIRRMTQTIIPRGTDKIEVSDLMFIVTEPTVLPRIKEISGAKDFIAKNIMILGGSRIGFKTAKSLEHNCYVKLIEKDKQKCMDLAEQLDKTLVINSEGRSEDILVEEGIKNAEVFVAVTGNSEVNILSCLLAKKLGVKKTIAEVENNDYLYLARNMNIDIIINKKLIAASYIFGFTSEAKIANVQNMTAIDAEVLEFLVPKNAKIAKKQLKDIDFPKDAIIGGVVRTDKTFVAVGDTQLQEGDKVVVFALEQSIDKVVNLFK